MVEIADKDAAIRHIRQGSSTGIWCYEEPDGHIEYQSGACHAGVMHRFNALRPFKWFASASAYGPKSATYRAYDESRLGTHTEGFTMSQAREDLKTSAPLYQYVQEYLRWLCGPESPYRNVHKNDVELVLDDEENIRGFILGPSAFGEGCSYPAIFNFCIANRIVRDYSGYLGRFGALRHRLGLSMLQAFLLTPYFSFREGALWVKTNNTWDGSHLPLKEFRYLNKKNPDDVYGGIYNSNEGYQLLLDIQRLKDSNVNSEITSTYRNTEVWMSPPKPKEKIFSHHIGNSTTISTRFSKISKFEESNIVEFAKEFIG